MASLETKSQIQHKVAYNLTKWGISNVVPLAVFYLFLFVVRQCVFLQRHESDVRFILKF